MGDLAVTQVLERFYLPLAYAIQNPASIPLWTPGNRYGVSTKAVPVQMRPDEIEAWDYHFKIRGNQRPESVAFSDGVLTPRQFGQLKLKVTKELGDGCFLANEPGNKFWVYDWEQHGLSPFNTDGIVWYLQPRGYIQPAKDGRTIQSAGIEIKLFITDKHGRLAVSTPRPMRPTFSARVYDKISLGSFLEAYQPAYANLSFNTELKHDEEGKPPAVNKLEFGLDTETRLVLSAELHKPDEIDKIVVPDNSRLNLFFNQVEAFLAPVRDGDKTIDNLFSEKRQS